MKKHLFTIIISLTIIASCSNSDTNEENSNNSPFTIWMGQQTGSTGNFSNLRWMVVLPNGKYFNQLPTEGFLNFSENQTGGTWGTFATNGNSGTFTNQYETLHVNKISNTEMEIVGYTNHIYKLSSVNGLILSGKYNTIPNWSTIPNYPYATNDFQPMIEFFQDGSFLDLGAFLTNFTMPYQNPDRAPGIGSYEIDNFTLILNYDDGRTITKAFSGIFNNPVNSSSELVLIGGNPFYNN